MAKRLLPVPIHDSVLSYVTTLVSLAVQAEGRLAEVRLEATCVM